MSASTGRFAFLDHLRVLAAWSVVYDHILCVRPAEHGMQFGFVGSIERAISAPFGIIQNFGARARRA